MKASILTLKRNPLVLHVDDERSIGNGIIVTLKEEYAFYDDCGVMGFDTCGDASRELRTVKKAGCGR